MSVPARNLRRISYSAPSCLSRELPRGDRDRLFLAFHGLAASAALERASLAALHGALDVVGRGLGVSSHGVFSSGIQQNADSLEEVP